MITGLNGTKDVEQKDKHINTKYMKNRVIENWITSAIGIGVFGLAGVLLYQAKIDYIAFTALLALGFTYLRAKDSIIPGAEAK